VAKLNGQDAPRKEAAADRPDAWRDELAVPDDGAEPNKEPGRDDAGGDDDGNRGGRRRGREH
jgi:hypothetical protein